MLKKIITSEIVILAVMGLYFFPVGEVLQGVPYIGELLQLALRGVLLFIILFYLPGYWWSYVFFKENELTSFERIVVSIAISLAVTIFVSLYLSLGGIEVSTRWGLITSSIAICSGIVIVFIRGGVEN